MKISYLHPRLIAILLLGFSSGLPRLLVASTLSALLSDSHIERATIGLFAYTSLPYAFNFIWAPLIDNFSLPYFSRIFGRRTGWMIFSQICLIFTLIYMAILDPASTPLKLAITALLIAFFSSIQDIVIDAYRTEYLHKNQYGEGAAMAVFGYRIGMLIAGAGSLTIADLINWKMAYITMAIFMFIGMITAIVAGEPVSKNHNKRQEADNILKYIITSVVTPFTQFANDHKNWLLILVFIALYRIPDGFIGFMATPFMLDVGFSKTEIAAIGKLYGFGATIAGTFIGGLLIHKIGLWKSLFTFALSQILTNLTYIIISIVGTKYWALVLAITSDNLSGGAVTAAAITLMMNICNSKYTATQYALLSSLAALGSILLSGSAGYVANAYGRTNMFILSAIIGIPAILLLFKLKGIQEMNLNSD